MKQTHFQKVQLYSQKVLSRNLSEETCLGKITLLNSKENNHDRTETDTEQRF